MQSSEKFAVIGDPISHSKSPQLHNEFGKEFKLKLSYDKIHTHSSELAARVDNLIELGYRGFNVTLPLKEGMYKLGVLRGYDLSERSIRAQSVNTVSIKKEKIFLDNTDGAGFIKSMNYPHGFNWHKKNLLIIGAGGAAKGIIGPILDVHPARITISNRSLKKIKLLRERFSSPLLSFNLLNDLNSDSNLNDYENTGSFDVIVNATSSSVSMEDSLINPKYFRNAQLIVDLFYAKKLTSFLRVAKEYGCINVMDGFPMLVEQAAESFYVWTGLKPDTNRIISQRDIFFE